MEENKLKKINLQLFAEPKVEDENEGKKDEDKNTPKPDEGKKDADLAVNIEALFAKKFENLEKRVMELEQVKRLTCTILSNGVFQKFIVFSLIGSIAYFLGHFDIISKILTLLK